MKLEVVLSNSTYSQPSNSRPVDDEHEFFENFTSHYDGELKF